jgi:hypothetical protein
MIFVARAFFSGTFDGRTLVGGWTEVCSVGNCFFSMDMVCVGGGGRMNRSVYRGGRFRTAMVRVLRVCRRRVDFGKQRFCGRRRREGTSLGRRSTGAKQEATSERIT